jgi:hypothetical protein
VDSELLQEASIRQHAALQFDTVGIKNSSDDTSSTANILLPQPDRPAAAGAAPGADRAMYGYYDLTWQQQQQQHGDQGAFAAPTFGAVGFPTQLLSGPGAGTLQQQLALATATAVMPPPAGGAACGDVGAGDKQVVR